MNGKVYLITSGSFSSYRIIRVFTNEKRAEHYKKKLEDDTFCGKLDIEEHDLDDESDFSSIGWVVCRGISSGKGKGFSEFIGEPEEAGKVWWYCRRIDPKSTEWFLDIEESYELCKRGAFRINKDTYSFYLLSDNKDDALRIANETYESISSRGDLKENVVYDLKTYNEIHD